MVEQEVVFLMDRFGYAKTIDTAAYDRNREAAHAENKYVFTCMNTDKICIFTDNGNLHQIKVKDIPFIKFRDKGTPIDNLGNYSSAGEEIVFLCCNSLLEGRKLLFTTKKAMMKLVDGSEFDVSKKTVAATKLLEGDAIVSIEITDARSAAPAGFKEPDAQEGDANEQQDGAILSSQNVVLQSENGYFLKFPLNEIPEKKKGAVGVRGLKLEKEDYITNVYVVDAGDNTVAEYKGNTVEFRKLKTSKRDGKGTKVKAK